MVVCLSMWPCDELVTSGFTLPSCDDTLEGLRRILATLDIILLLLNYKLSRYSTPLFFNFI